MLPAPSARLRVAALYVYPLKGAAGIPVVTADVTPRGLGGDRRWMVAGADGRFLSGRTHPAFVRLAARPVPGGLRLEADGHPPLDVETPGAAAPPLRGDVWGSRLALREAPEARAWLRAWLGADARLAYQPDETHRPADAALTPGHEVSLADAFPLLVTTEPSRRDLEARAGLSFDVRRFRPNVVVEGERLAPWAEDGWGRVHLGEVAFRAVKPCARCSVTTLDPDTAEAGPEPLRTLAAFRKRGSKVLFGHYLVPLAGGALRVGDGVVDGR